MKICSSCGAGASSGIRRCLACGSNLFFYVCENCGTKYETLRCPQCGVARESREKICPNCGRHSFDTRCPDCGCNLRSVAPIRAEIPPETYAVHAGEGTYATDEVDRAREQQKASGCGIAAFALAVLGYFCSSEIGLPGLTFLVPSLALFALGIFLTRVNNRRVWALVAAGAILAISAVMLAMHPDGWNN